MNAKIALVTGANKGIGLETVRQLAQKGMKVYLAARDIAKGETAAAHLRAEKLDVQAMELDVVNAAHRKAAHERIAAEHGRLDILVNNAGIAPEAGLHPSNVPVDLVRQVFETNFFAAIALTQTMLPLLRKSEGGRIVNLSSRLGSMSANADAPAQGWYDELGYNSSKAALNMFTILLAKELAGTAIKINSAHPGWVKTDMGGANAPLTPVEGASTSVQLATFAGNGPSGGFFHLHDHMAW